MGPLAQCRELLTYGNELENGVLAVSGGLLLVWGIVLMSALIQSTGPRALLGEWCRNWMMPLLIFGAGLALLGNGGGTVGGRWLDGVDLWMVRFVMDARPTPPGRLHAPADDVTPDKSTLSLCPDTSAGLEVEGCIR